MTDTYEESKEKKSTFMPIILAAGVTLLFLGLVISFPLAMGGLMVLSFALLKIIKDSVEGKFEAAKEALAEKWPLESLGKEKTGMWVFLMSEILIFGSLIVAYVFIRINSNTWIVSTQTQNVMLGLTLSIILLTSGLAMALAVYWVRVGNLTGLKIGLVNAFLLGFVFDLIHFGYEWPQLIKSGFTLKSGLPGSSYFLITGLHGAHVAAGVVAIGYLIIKAFNGGFSSAKYTAVESIGLYWAFVDIVWMFLFPLFYLI